MNSAGWMILRFCLCGWIGAASLFVVTGIREVTSPLFEPLVKNQLAALRFPAYYAFGFALVGISFVVALLLNSEPAGGTRRLKVIRILVGLVLCAMIADYVAIFQPLYELMDDPTARETPAFQSYHWWSMIVNFASVATCLAAALISTWSSRPKAELPAEAQA